MPTINSPFIDFNKGFSNLGLGQLNQGANSQDLELSIAIGKQTAEIKKAIASAGSSLYDSYNALSRNQRTYEISLFGGLTDFFGETGRANLELLTMQNNILYKNELATLDLEKTIRDSAFKRQKSNIDTERGITKSFLNYQKNLADLNLKGDIYQIEIDKLKARKDLQTGVAKAQKQGVKAQLTAHREILDSLKRTGTLLNQRGNVLDNRLGLNLQDQQLQTQQGISKERAIAFESQRQTASERATRQLLTGAYSEVLGAVDVDRTSDKMQADLAQAIAQVERTELKKDEIVEEYKQQRINLALQKEGLSRSVSGTKGTIGRLKAQIKGINADLKNRNTALDFAIKGYQAKQKAVGIFKGIASKEYRSQRAYLRAINAYNQKVSNFNEKVGNTLYTIRMDNNQRALNLAYKNLDFRNQYASRRYAYKAQLAEMKRRENEDRIRKEMALAGEILKRLRNFNKQPSASIQNRKTVPTGELSESSPPVSESGFTPTSGPSPTSGDEGRGGPTQTVLPSVGPGGTIPSLPSNTPKGFFPEGGAL